MHSPRRGAGDSLLSSSSVIVSQKAFTNYNGLVTGLVCSPVPVQSFHPPDPSNNHTLPPPWLAVVIDASMDPESLQSAKEGLEQALIQLPKQTRLLLAVVDQVVSFIDLRSPAAPAWVLHSAASPAASSLPHLVRAADIRATPLAHCFPHLPAILSSIRHYSQACTQQLHLHTVASALDISVYLLTASMAAWDANQRSKQQQNTTAPGPGEPKGPSPSPVGGQQPIHSAQVIFITGRHPDAATPAAVAATGQPLQASQAAHLQQLFSKLATKAERLDVPIDVVTGSPAAPAWAMLQPVVGTSRGSLLYQPSLLPPFGANLATTAMRRVGWDGAINIKLPRGVKLAGLQGPLAGNHALPAYAAQASSYGSASSSSKPGMDASRNGSTQAQPQQQQQGAAAAAGGQSPSIGSSSSSPQPAGNTAKATAAMGALSLKGWGEHAIAMPAVHQGMALVVQLELLQDFPAGSSFDVEVLCQWASRDGQRWQQEACKQMLVSERLSDYLNHLDTSTAALLLVRQLLVAALEQHQAAVQRSKGLSQRLRVLEEAQLGVGVQLVLMGQRMGHVHTERKGFLGFGAQQVWQLPDQLVPLAVAMYLLQHGPLLGARPPTHFGSQPACGLASARVGAVAGRSPTSNSSSSSISQTPAEVEAVWQLQVHELLGASTAAAQGLAAPVLWVYDPHTAGFHRALPVDLAISSSSLVVLDAGLQLVVYAGRALQPKLMGGAGAAAEGGLGPPDMAMVAAPAVQHAQQLAAGRYPVPRVQVVESEEQLLDMLSMLVPLHADRVQVQMLLLPLLRQVQPSEHGLLVEWHKSMAAGVSIRRQWQWQQQKQQPPTFEQWCCSLNLSLPVDHELAMS